MTNQPVQHSLFATAAGLGPHSSIYCADGRASIRWARTRNRLYRLGAPALPVPLVARGCVRAGLDGGADATRTHERRAHAR